MKTHLSLPALAVTATCLLLRMVSAAPLPADVLFQEDFENPDVPSYFQGITPDIWVRAALGFGSGDHGMTDKSGGDFSAPSGNEQGYAFRYSNSGITTKEKALGSPLAFGGGYEVSFDVVKDNSTGGIPYNVKLIAFGAGAVRDDCRSTPTGSTVLASATGNAPSNGSISTVTFTFIPNATTHAAEFGKDLGIRVNGGTNSIIDNIKFRAIPGTASGLNLVTTSPLDNSVNNLATSPVKAIFSKNISAGTGNITLRNLTDTIDTVIPVGDPRINITGTCLDIVAGAPYTWGKNYAVLVDNGAVVENPGAAPFTGITDPTAWNFTTAGGDPLLYSISQLKSHVTGAITLSAAEIDTIKRNLDTVAGRFAESSTSITALLDLVTTYDTSTITGRKGPLWVTTGLPKRDVVTNDLHWTMFNVMQNIMDRIYTRQTLAAHESLLNGFKYGSSSNFPGACAAPAPNTYTAAISANYLKTYGPTTLGDGPGTYARKPTGCYLAPGTIVTVTVPPSMVNTGYKIRVGCHSPDFSAKPDIKRLDRVTRVYDITSAQTKVASPLGGGIYIEVPWLANAGVPNVTVDISGAVRSPYFSAKSFHSTTASQWEIIERTSPAPWADFQTDKFMMQVPKTWISAMTGAQAIQLMADWDAAMDAINDLMGYTAYNPATGPAKYLRGKENMYPQVDLLLKNSVYAPGYPSINTTYSPTGSYGGYATSHLVRGPQNAPDYEFHELGHGYLFPKFGGESESAVNLLHVAVWNRKFGKSMDEAFRKSRGYTRTYMTLDTTAMAWMCVFNFSPRKVPMADGEKAYQLKGHAKFVDIANLYGWDVLGKFWGTMVDFDNTNTSYPTDNDAMLLRLCKAVGKDIRPLFHFWGIYPQNPSALAASIAAANPPLPADPAIRTRLLSYKAMVPANNAAFRTFALGWWGKQPSINGYWEEREHARQWDTTALYGPGDQQRSEATNPGEIYNENSALDITNRIQELVDLYFPGAISPNTMTFSIAPSAVNATTVGMTATTATAATGPIQYYFENTTNSTNSGWITSSTWSQTGLTTGVPYSFRVKARDGLPIETLWSAPASATPGADVTPPSPSPMNFTTAPTAMSETSITMTAASASDVSGVEYFFDSTTPGGNDSGWQDSPTYTDSGLNPSTQYTYQVRARDKSPAQNVTAFSATASATTPTPDLVAPSVLTLNPADNATDVPVGNSLVITFNEPIGPGSGFVTIKNLTNATETAIDISDQTQITISGADLTINPATNLLPGNNFAVRIDPTALQDLAGNGFAGITDDTTWNFTSAVVPFVWTQTAGNAQAWDTGTNWLAGTSPSPITGDTVDFSTANIVAATTLTLGADRTAQLWKFGDATTASHDWIVSAGNKMILAGTTPTLQVVNRTATLNNIVDGSAGLTKTGGGTLALANTANTYTGGTVISGGNLTIAADGSLGSGTVTVNANATINIPTATFVFNRPFILNNGASLVTNIASAVVTVNGAVTGTGSIAPFNQSGANLTLASTANTFTGSFQLASGIQQAGITVNSIGDGGTVFLGGTSYGQANFRYGAGAVAPLVLSTRTFTLGTSGGGKGVIQNDNTANSHANTITINTDLLAPNAGARTLELGGVNAGINTFAGKLIDGAGTVSLNKAGIGNWALSGTNTYTGATVNNFGNPSGGSLIFQGLQALPPATTLSQTHAGGTGGFGTIKLMDDAPTPASRAGVKIAMTASNTSHTMTLFVGNNGTANGGSGTGGTTGSTIALGNLTFTQTVSGNTSQTLAVTGANGYKLQLNNVNLPGLVAASTTWNGTLTPSAPLTIVGNVQQAVGNAAGVLTLTLDGTASGNLISGNISDSLDATPKPLKLTKSNSSTWTLSGANVYTGLTTVSGGKLFINGDQTAASGAITVAANATLGGTGTLGGSTTIAATGKLEFHLSTAAGSHDKLELAASKTLNFSGTSVLTITSSGGASTGSYPLVSAPGGISGVTPATLNLPAGWAATVSKVGTDLVLNVTSTGSSNTYANWIGTYPGAAAMPGFTQDADGDGIKNGVENFFGTNPGTFSAGMVAGTKSSNTFTFTHPQNSTPASNITAVYRWSRDLATFHAAGTSDGAGTSVSFNTSTNAGITTVTATVSGTATAKLFVDVKVSQN